MRSDPHRTAAAVEDPSQPSIFDRKARTEKFRVGDSVWLYNPIRKKGRSPKLDKMWQGPYGVISLIGEVLIENKASRRAKSKVVHADKLAKTICAEKTI